MRQKDDRTYAEALSRLAQGQLNANDICMFQSREINNKTVFIPHNCLHLFTTNDAVDKHNSRRLKD